MDNMSLKHPSQCLHQQPQPSQHLYQNANQSQHPLQYPPANWYDTWDRQASQSFSSTSKGLQNAPGENNCFLNSAVQVIFTQFQYSDQSSLPPNALRKALAETFSKQERFQLGHMDDAAECFENILRRIHYHIANSHNEDTCNVPHCLPHQKFAMKVSDQLVCPCGASSNPLTFQEMVHYVSASALVNQSRAMHENGDILHPDRFGLLLRNAGTSGDIRDCPANCGRRVQIRRTLLNTPDVVSIGLVWDSDHPDADLTTEVAQSIGTVLLLPDIFHVVMCDNVATLPKLHLSAMVCYYGKHYFTFVYHTKLQEWIYFDDTTVRQIGSRWENVVDKCSRGRYQPLLLIYTNPTATPISTETAPQKRIMAPGYSVQGVNDQETQKEGPVNSIQQTSGRIQDIPNSRSSAPHVEAYQLPSASRPHIATQDKSKPEGETELTRKSSFDHRRQTSFLFAVSGKDSLQQGSSQSDLSAGYSSGNQQLSGREFYARNNAIRPVTEEATRQDVPDAYSYTLSTNDQYRRPSLNQADASKVPPLALNISRATDVQKKDSFRRGRGKIPADVIRYQVDPSRYSSTSSSESEGSPVFPSSIQTDSAPEGPKQPVITPNHTRTCSQSVEDSLGGNSQETLSNAHKVVKPKPTIPQAYENINNSSHTPVQSGLATLPRKKKTVNGKQTAEIVPQSQHIHARQNSQSGEIKQPRQTSLKDGIPNFNASFHQGFYPPDHQAIRLSQDALMAHNCQTSEIQMVDHSRQSSSSSIQSQNTVVELPQGEISKPASSQHSRQSSLVGQEPIAEKTKEKTKSSGKSRKDEKRSKLKNKTATQNPGKLLKGLEKKANDVDEGFHDEKYYIDRRMVESVLSFQKLQRQGSIQSTVSQTSNSSLDSDNFAMKGKGQVALKENLSGEIPFDNLSIGSHKDSGYGSSDRNSSSSTGSVTLNPYEQYFMSRSMIPPKTFSASATNENVMKVLGLGNTSVGPGYLREQDLKSIYQNVEIACPQNQNILHCTEVSQPNLQLTKSQSALLDLSNMSRDEKNLQIYEILKSRSKPVQPPLVPSGNPGHQQQAQSLDGKPPVGSGPRNTNGQQRDLSKQNRDDYEDRNYMNVTTQDGSQEIKPGEKILPVYQDFRSNPYLNDGNPTPQGTEQYSPTGPSMLPGYNEVADQDFVGLCRQAEDLMDQCVLAETSQEFQQALNYCQKAIDCLKQAMKLPNISQQSYVFAQMRHNSCVLKSRSLQKKSLMRQESNTSTNSSDSERPMGGRSPVPNAIEPDSPPHDSYQKCLRASAFQYLQPQAATLMNRPPSRSSSQNSIDSLKDGRSSSGSSTGRSSTPVGGERMMQQPALTDKKLTPGVENNRFSELQDRLNCIQANGPTGMTQNSVDTYRSLPHRHLRGPVDFNSQTNCVAAKDVCNKLRTSSNPDQEPNHVRIPSVTSGSSTPTPMDNQDYYVNGSVVSEQFQKSSVNNQNNMTGKAEVRQLVTKQSINMYPIQQELAQSCNMTQAAGSVSTPQQGTERRAPNSTRLQVTEVGKKNIKSLPFPPAKPDWLKPGDKATSGHGNHTMGQLIVRKLPTTTFSALQTAHSANVQTSVQAGQCMPVPTHSANTMQSTCHAFSGSERSHLARSASFSALDCHQKVPSITATSVYNSKPDTSSMTEVSNDAMHQYSTGPNQPSISSTQQLGCNPSGIAQLQGVCSSSADNSDVSALEKRISVRDLACRFESSTNVNLPENGGRQANNSSINVNLPENGGRQANNCSINVNLPENGGRQANNCSISQVEACENVRGQEQISKVSLTAYRQRSKSESENVRAKPKPKSVLAKRNKKCEDRPRKSVTFSDNIAMIAAADSWESAIAAQMTSGYISDEEDGVHKLPLRGARCDDELDDDDSSGSPVEVVGDSACSLCHKKGVEFGQSYCAKCTLYMSRFMPSR
ncbi:hypothetical protein ACJMK2_034042 [Sinanodonta woodiana]|uniref:USP domain-containing protein n=1 Tax=Sinanodonta woodiana TaxID=1069815 RepID=A0ABD3WQC3_SINWO